MSNFTFQSLIQHLKDNQVISQKTYLKSKL